MKSTDTLKYIKKLKIKTETETKLKQTNEKK